MVILDDFDLVTEVVLGNCYFYPRRGYLEAPLKALAAYASSAGKRLVFGCGGSTPGAVRQRSQFAGIPEFQVADYTALCQIFLGAEAARSLDCRKIHRFAPKLNAHQLRAACEFLKHERRLETERFIDYLRSQRMVSNVDLGEVQAGRPARPARASTT